MMKSDPYSSLKTNIDFEIKIDPICDTIYNVGSSYYTIRKAGVQPITIPKHESMIKCMLR